jgi:hypothetical protein
MGWGLTAAWFAVIGTLVLTFGTGAQAWANLAEFKSLQASVSAVVSDIISDQAAATRGTVLDLLGLRLGRRAVGDGATARASNLPSLLRLALLFARLPWQLLERRLTQSGSIQSAVFLMPRRLSELRDKGGEEAVEMTRFLRSAKVWGILMIGSALGLAAAAIQLALAYQ